MTRIIQAPSKAITVKTSASLFVLPTLLLIGCSRSNPVEEISVSKSGIAVVDQSDAVPAEDLPWSGWRGPNGNGIANDQPLLTTWSKSENVIWTADVPGRGHSSPIVVGDLVCLATAIEKSEKQQVLAFDRATGDAKWTKDIHQGGFPSKREIHDKATNANGTAVSDGQRIYLAFFNSGAITASAIDLKGEIAWQKEIGKFVSKFGYAPSPLIYKSLVIFAVDNSGGGYIAALDRETGSIAWRVKRPSISSYSSPTLATVGGKDQLLISGCDAIESFDPATGEKNWSTSCISEATCGTVVTTGNLIFASGGYPDKETVCLDASGKKVWSNRTKIYEPSLTVHQDRVVAVSDDGIAYCWNAQDGDVIWKKRLGGKFSASPVVCNGLFYVPNLSGDTIVFRNENDTFQLVGKNRFGSDCYASPAVADSQLFLRVGIGSGASRREQLVCLSEPSVSE